MINAREARHLMKSDGEKHVNREVSRTLRKINKEIKRAAKQGYGSLSGWNFYVGRKDVTELIIDELESLGYEAQSDRVGMWYIKWSESE